MKTIFYRNHKISLTWSTEDAAPAPYLATCSVFGFYKMEWGTSEEKTLNKMKKTIDKALDIE